jgi:hypothetical protein
MERYCGYLQAGLRSRIHPWANLNNRVLHKAYLEQIDVYYDLQDDLSITSPAGLQKGEKFFEQCKFFDILSYFTILMYINVRPTLNFTPTLPNLIPARQLT